ncbi:hypothetical protein NDU88_003242 [Pleurodeles waltl]|uniref:Uncharacterized protein n=1 Tax=Pleurodeles waltl TaxID=8319 RepID=A0AAV7W4S5_PLEWA|nr:hypothetical protein NDU88_003242 [Pleurodeles waltl]
MGLWPRRALRTARGQRKGTRRAPRPLTRTALPPRFGRDAPQRPAVQHVWVYYRKDREYINLVCWVVFIEFTFVFFGIT